MSDIDTLVEMGFERNRAEKALSATKNQGVQLAMDWLFAHADDVDIDEAFKPSVGHTLGQVQETAVQADEEQDSGTTVKDVEEPASKQQAEGEVPHQACSLKCEDCGKLLKSASQAEMHAGRTGHQNFAESTEEIKPLTEEEKKKQMDSLQTKMADKRQQRLEQEKQENIEREKIRRKSGRESTDYKQKFVMQEAQKIAEQRKREKIEEKKLRQKLKEQIAQDRTEKASKSNSSAKTLSSPSSPPASSTPQTSAPKEYTSCRLQFRLTNGISITGTFEPTDTLSKVVSYISSKRTDGAAPFSLSMTFPRKTFSELDMDKTLKDCGLVPSAVLMLTKH